LRKIRARLNSKINQVFPVREVTHAEQTLENLSVTQFGLGAFI
jgi:hypothetical protein